MAAVIERTDSIQSHEKYDRDGAFHWDAFRRPTLYRNHALFLLETIREHPVLDVGCGDGVIAWLLSADGVDISPTAVRMAREHGVPARVGSVYDPPPGPYAAVLLSDVLEHLQYPMKAIEAMAPVTRTLYVSVPFRVPFLYSEEWHYWHFTLSDLDALCTPLGWRRVWSHIGNLKTYAKYQRPRRLYLRDRWTRYLASALRAWRGARPHGALHG